MRNVRVASVQFEHAPGDKRANLNKIRSFVEQAAREQVQIIAFPECCITGYWFLRNLPQADFAALAEPVFAGPSSQELIDLSRTSGITIGAGLIEAGDDGRFYKAYVVAMPDGTARRHRKIHAFVSPYLTCGDSFTVFDTPHGCRVGALICYDCNIVENVRITALMGAEVLLAPHQTGGCRTSNMGVIDRALWENRHADPETIEREMAGPKGRGWLMRWLPSRAHDNGMFLVFSNGVGVDDDEIRTGHSMILDPYGSVLAETGKAGDDMVIADLDPELLEKSTVPTGLERSTRELRFKSH
jgi:predicted amidohydrolase